MKERGLINSIRKLFDKPLHNQPDWASKIEAEEAADWTEWASPSGRAVVNGAASVSALRASIPDAASDCRLSDIINEGRN